MQMQAQQGRFCICHKSALVSSLSYILTPLLRMPHLPLCRLDTVEQAELQYKKQEKKEAPAGWDVFNPKTLYNAYLKRAEKVGLRGEEEGGVEKKEAPAGWDVLNAKTLFNAYLKRAEKLWVRLEEGGVEKKGGACSVDCAQPSNPVQCLFE